MSGARRMVAVAVCVYEYRASSRKVIFKTGVFHKDHWYGKHSRDPSDHSSVIKLYEQGQGFLGIRCYA